MNRPFPLPEDLRQRDPVASIVRAAIAAGRYQLDRMSGLQSSAAQRAQQAWPLDQDVQLVLRGASAPTDTTAPGLAHVALAFLPLLTPYSAAARLCQYCPHITFGRDGSVLVPNISLVPLGFTAEGMPKAVLQGVSSNVQLLPCKIPGIVVVSAELLMNPAIEGLMRTLLAESAAPALDLAMFSANAAVPGRPAGILNGITPLTAATSALSRYDALIQDLGNLAGAIASAAGGADIAFIMNHAQAISTFVITPRPFTAVQVNVLSTNAVPAGTVIAVALNALVSAIEAPTFDTATETTLHMSDTPLPLVSGTGVVAVPQSSMFQTDRIAIKMVTNVSWGVRSPIGVAWMQNVVW
jgi:hypothetical protein